MSLSDEKVASYGVHGEWVELKYGWSALKFQS